MTKLVDGWLVEDRESTIGSVLPRVYPLDGISSRLLSLLVARSPTPQ